MAKTANLARLLNARSAAAYCSMSLAAFSAHCPVKPISLGPDARLRRYDIRALDAWIDSLNGPAGQSTDWLSKLEAGDEAI